MSVLYASLSAKSSFHDKFSIQGNLPPLRKSVVSDDIEMQFEESPCSSCVEFGTDEWKCKVDFPKMTSMTTAGQERKLRRRPQFVSSDEFEKLKSQYVLADPQAYTSLAGGICIRDVSLHNLLCTYIWKISHLLDICNSFAILFILYR